MLPSIPGYTPMDPVHFMIRYPYATPSQLKRLKEEHDLRNLKRAIARRLTQPPVAADDARG